MKTLLTICLGLMVSAGVAHAQVGIAVGPRGGLNIGDDVGSIFLGGDARASIVALPVDLNASFDYYFGEDYIDFWHLHLGVLYAVEIADLPAAPYIGGGLGIQNFSIDTSREFEELFGSASSTEIGIDLLAGAYLEVENLQPFVQVGLTFGDADLFTLGGGILFTLGGE